MFPFLLNNWSFKFLHFMILIMFIGPMLLWRILSVAMWLLSSFIKIFSFSHHPCSLQHNNALLILIGISNLWMLTYVNAPTINYLPALRQRLYNSKHLDEERERLCVIVGVLHVFNEHIKPPHDQGKDFWSIKPVYQIQTNLWASMHGNWIAYSRNWTISCLFLPHLIGNSLSR